MPKNIILTDAVAARLEAHRPEYLSLTAFLHLLIDQSLTGGLDYPRTVSVREPHKATYALSQVDNSPPQQLASEASSEATLPTVAAPVDQPAQEIEPKKKNKGTNHGKKPRAKRTKGSPDFEAFWAAYQAIDHRANKQAKPQAWEVWKQLIDDDIAPADLMRALEVASADVQRRLRSGEFASPFPDCFRWLRDECYAVYLENHQSPASLITVYG